MECIQMANAKKKLNKKTQVLLRNLIPIMARCYNRHSTRAYWLGGGNVWYEEGQYFRYPVTFTTPEGDWKMDQYETYPELDKEGEVMRSARCKFGANDMYIAQNLLAVLEYLKEHHNLKY